MMTVIHQEADLSGPTVMKYQVWWNRNCLYLEPKARDAFSLAYSSIGLYRGLVADRVDVETIESNWLNIIGAGDIIVKAVELPGLTEPERGDLKFYLYNTKEASDG